MTEVDKRQELSLREVELIRELAQIRKEKSEELEFEKFDGYELPPRTQFSMVKKPAVSIKYGEMTFNMACIRLFEGIKYILPIVNSLVAGLTASGADAYLLHVTTTPSVAYIARVDDFDCGIMISASHNPFYDNGIKLIDCTVDYVAGRNRYMGYLISLGIYSFKGVKVGLDCANGASWNIAKSVFDALGADTYVINNKPNGTNINNNAGSTHIEGLQKFVVEKGLDVGFAYDSIALTASCYSYHTLEDGEQPNKGIQLMWCILLILLPIALLFAESSMNNLQSVSIVAAFPIGAVIVMIAVSFMKDAKKYMESLEDKE